MRNETKTTTRDHRGRGPTPGALALIILVVSLMIIGFGLQQARFQDQMQRRADCSMRWGDEMVDSITSRTDALSRLSQAERDRDDAVDAVLLFVTANKDVKPPPPASILKQYGRVLSNFAEAKSHLDKVRRETEVTRTENPYPRLEC